MENQNLNLAASVMGCGVKNYLWPTETILYFSAGK